MKRRLVLLLVFVGMIMSIVPAATAAVHPQVCSRGVEPAGLDNNPARSPDVANPPGITFDGDIGFGPHDDALEAADDNPVPQFRPLVVKFFGPADENSLNALKDEGECHND